jgi:uncharacterized membrane protein YgcG
VKYTRIFGVAALAATAAYGQHVISAKSGLIHYVEGDVSIEGKPVVVKAAEFPDLKPGEQLRTGLGRAEILLSPGVFLRLSEEGGVRMVSNALEDTRIELTGGSLLLEVGEVQKGQMLVVAVGPAAIEFPKRGLYRVDFDPARIQVHDGSAIVVAGGQTVTVKEGRRALLAGVIAPEKFNKETTDALHRWARRRSEYVAMANVAAARSLDASGVAWRTGGWWYNPYFGAFTYIPANGMYRCPFGFAFYSPRTVDNAYRRPDAWAGSSSIDGGGGGASRGYSDYGGSRGSASYGGGSTSSSGVSAAPPSTSAPAAAAPARGSDAGTSGRESRGGR